MKGITFATMKEAKNYGDQMDEQGYEVDIQKKGKYKFVVKASEPVEVEEEGIDGLSEEATSSSPQINLDRFIPAGSTVMGKAEQTLQVVSGKGIGRMFRPSSDMRIGGAELNPHMYDPTKGGQRARIAQLPKIKYEEIGGDE